MEVPSRIWNSLVQHENRDLDPESYKSSAGYLFSPYDGARSIAEIVFGGLLDPERLARADSIHHFDSASPSAGQIMSMLVGFAEKDAVSPRRSDLSEVLESQFADQLMVLSVDDNATPEIRSLARSTVLGLPTWLRQNGFGAIADNIDAFRRDPKQNVPKLKPSGTPPGPPV